MKLSRETKIYFMLVITGSFFLVEIIIGYYVSSLALIADSFHMLNDLLSMCVALWAIKVAKKTHYDPKYSYGWQRAEILGALINGVFLLALCFTILIDSIERFVSPEPVTHPIMVLITGGAGLLANIVGLFLFHEHGHGHGGHSHNHNHESNNNTRNEHLSSLESQHDLQHHEHELSHGGHLNMRGIFLHVLGDALGNVGVIASALFIWLTPFSWRFYFDPLVSTLITIIIFMSAIPLVRQTSFILLQGVPNSVPLEAVYEALLQLEGVISVHEFHVWQLSDTKLIASLHVLLKSRQGYMVLASQIRKVLHGYGIHSATIQPEFVEDQLDEKYQVEPENDHDHDHENDDDEDINIVHFHTTSNVAKTSNRIYSSKGNNDNSSTEDLHNSSTCLLRCIEDSCLENTCCPPDQQVLILQKEQDNNK